MSNLVAVAKLDEIPAGSMKGFTVEGKEILVANYNGKFYAIGGKCTHRGGPLPKGKLEGKIVTCPRHGSQFDVTTGNRVRGPAIINEPAYEVTIDGNSIKINV